MSVGLGFMVLFCRHGVRDRSAARSAWRLRDADLTAHLQEAGAPVRQLGRRG
ncbi:MAG TPA: hypothetical protein VK891_13175 [Euzebyales bacterium]|nr:hypothetical protein [Euzebyales bacterium]